MLRGQRATVVVAAVAVMVVAMVAVVGGVRYQNWPRRATTGSWS